MMGEWRPVCDDGWDVNAATVVCKEHNISTEGIVGSICVYTPKSVLVFTNAATIPMLRSYYSTEPSVHYWLDDIRCNGDELSLLNCTHAPPGVHDCGPYERAGVACETHLIHLPLSLLRVWCLCTPGNGTQRPQTEPIQNMTINGPTHHGIKVEG